MQMGEHERIAPVPIPTVAFGEGETTSFKEVQEIIKKARFKSAPGSNGIPFKVYKSCSKLLRGLWKQLKVVWRKDVPAEWQHANGIFVPKEEVSNDIGQFRTISLLSEQFYIEARPGNWRIVVQDCCIQFLAAYQ